jgi:hypothetical protein
MNTPDSPSISTSSDEVKTMQELPQVEVISRAPPALVALYNMWHTTTGSLTVDLRRPVLPNKKNRRSLFFVAEDNDNISQPAGYNTPQPALRSNRNYTPSRFFSQRQQRTPHNEEQQQPKTGIWASLFGTPPPARPNTAIASPPRKRQGRRATISPEPPSDYSMLKDVAFGNSGARVKAMRHITFGPSRLFPLSSNHTETPTSPRPVFDIGAGLNFELDTAHLQPSLRLKYKDFISLKVLPEPAIKLQKRIPLGESGMGIRVRYECPLDSMAQFWGPPAKLLITIDNTVHSGVRLTQSGVEFDGQKTMADGAVRLRGSGVVRFPRELPMEEGQPLVGVDVKNLGIKTRW